MRGLSISKKGDRSGIRRDQIHEDLSDLLSAHEGLLSQFSGYKSSLNHYSVLHPNKGTNISQTKNKVMVDHVKKNAVKFVSSNKKHLEVAARKSRANKPKHSRQMSDIFFMTPDGENSYSPDRSVSNQQKVPSISNISYPKRDRSTDRY